MNTPVVDSVAVRLGVTPRAVKVFAGNGLLGELGVDSTTANAISVELGFKQNRDMQATSKPSTDDVLEVDDPSFDRLVFSANDMTRAERAAVYARWNKRSKLGACEVQKILQEARLCN